MPIYSLKYRAATLLLATILLAGCTTQTPPQAAQTSIAQPSAPVAVAPTTTATPAAWTFPAGSRIAGVDVGGMTPTKAIKLVSLGVHPYEVPLPLVADADTPADPALAITPAAVGIDPDVPQLVDQAEQAARAGQAVDVQWQPQVDAAKLRSAIEAVAATIDQAAATDVLTNATSLSATFTFRARAGLALDVDATEALITPLLIDRSQPTTATMVLETTEPARPDLAELKRVLTEHLGYWDGVGAIYVRDLQTGDTIGINENSVFSGASVMKVPIMIYTYSQLGKLNEQQKAWMQGMIIDSDNLDANALLAAAVGSQGTEAALESVNQMTAMLQGLGLEHTYQLIPYESAEWLIQQSKFPKGGPAREGEPPYTEADGYLRTTPREMGELFSMLAQCAEGEGKLLETYRDTLSEALCDEMMGWLEQPHDEERMVAGIPSGVKVAHKGGWINDMQSDVGIVSSPNGRYVAAIYVWQPDGYVTDIHASPSPFLGDFSHTIYTFFNPEPLP